jgi:hypothetical protein
VAGLWVMAMDLSGGQETILGEIPVFARLSIGTERLRLLVTGSRLIIAHDGKRGTGALGVTSLFGRLSGVVEDLLVVGGS